MNGLDKIIAQILDDAKQESLAIQEKAAGEAETTLAAAGEKVKKLEEERRQRQMCIRDRDREDGAGKGRKSGTEKRTEGDRRGLCSGVWRCRGKLFCRGVVCVAAG